MLTVCRATEDKPMALMPVDCRNQGSSVLFEGSAITVATAGRNAVATPNPISGREALLTESGRVTAQRRRSVRQANVCFDGVVLKTTRGGET